jgi:hypothetical protein
MPWLYSLADVNEPAVAIAPKDIVLGQVSVNKLSLVVHHLHGLFVFPTFITDNN